MSPSYQTSETSYEAMSPIFREEPKQKQRRYEPHHYYNELLPNLPQENKKKK